MSSNSQEEASNSLKRKNEVGIEEQNLEAGIKRVALEDDLVNSDTGSGTGTGTGSTAKPRSSEPEATGPTTTTTTTTKVSATEPETATATGENGGADSENDSSNVTTASNSEDTHNGSDTSGSQVGSDTVHLRMLCLVKEAGLVVGPKGETISRIKSETKARINVSNNIRGVPERVIYVKGTCDSVAKAFGAIARTLIAESNSKTRDMSRGGHAGYNNEEQKLGLGLELDTATESAEQAGTPIGSPDLDHEKLKGDQEEDKTAITLYLLIPHHLMGYVIGKRGSRLKEIEELSAAKLLASPDQLVPSNDRLLQVTGVPDAIHIATFYVAQTIAIFKDSRKNRKSVYYQPGSTFPVLSGPMGIGGFTGGIMVGNAARYGQNARSNSIPFPAFSISPVGFLADPQASQGRYQFIDSRYAPQLMRSGGNVNGTNGNDSDNNSNDNNDNNGNGNDNNSNNGSGNGGNSNDQGDSSLDHSRRVPSSPLIVTGSPMMTMSSNRHHHHHHHPHPNPHQAAAIPSSGPMGIIPGSVVYTPETVANAMSFVPNYSIPNVRIVERPFTAQPMAIVQQEIYIDENYVGNIIGREGRHINSIKRTTGCSIYIDPPVEGSRERKLTIKGTAMGSQAAIMLISNKIELDRANSNSRHRGIYQSSGPVNGGAVGQ